MGGGVNLRMMRASDAKLALYRPPAPPPVQRIHGRAPIRAPQTQNNRPVSGWAGPRPLPLGARVDPLLLLGAIASIVFALLLLGSVAFAHDHWINKGGYRNAAGELCCGEGDCEVVTGVDVRYDGFHLLDGEIVPFAEATPSPDGQYWRCHRHDGSRRCFFAPPPNS